LIATARLAAGASSARFCTADSKLNSSSVVFVVRVLSGAKLVQKDHLVQKKGLLISVSPVLLRSAEKIDSV
jgi:hypothetical protein